MTIYPAHAMRRLSASGWVLLLLGATGCTSQQERIIQKRAESVEALTEAHTRVVWVQDTADLNDVFARGSALRLMAYDSRDEHGERVLLEGPANFSKPMFTPAGDRVVFTDHDDLTTHLVHWDGSGRRLLTGGKALDVWKDPATDIEWVYVGTDPADTRAPSYRQIYRHPIDDPEQREGVWDGGLTGEDSFQLSADGRIAGGNFPWPDCGIVHLDEGRFERLGRGCWTSLAPDNAYLFWIFDGAHRNLLMFNTRTGDRWTVNISEAPGIDGHEAYHPRWSNHPRFIALTGPYMIRSGGNNIRGGGASVEVRIGRFSTDFQRLEKWVQVSSNDWANFAPDVWVQPTDASTDAMPSAPPKVATTQTDPTAASSLTVRVRILHASPPPTPEDILPYTAGLIAHEYEVLNVLEGKLAPSRILIAHWIIRDSHVLPDAHRAEGDVFTLRLERYDDRPELEGERLSMHLENMLLNLYYDPDS